MRRAEECVRLTNGTVELEVSTACGPRVLRYGRVGGRNVCGRADGLFTDTALGRWHPIGGHRLWVAPERIPASYAPDADPVDWQTDGPLRVDLRARPDAAGMQKTLTLALDPDGTRVVVTHLVVNRTGWPLTIAPWAITIVDPSGTALLPQPAYRSHSEQVLPAGRLVQWAYTDLADSRWQLGRRLIRLTPDGAKPDAQKLGSDNAVGWCAVAYDDCTFLKRITVDANARYPDLGCTTEFFTAGAYLEVETLAPLRTLEPGEGAVHVETWQLATGIERALDDDQLERAIQAELAAAPHTGPLSG